MTASRNAKWIWVGAAAQDFRTANVRASLVEFSGIIALGPEAKGGQKVANSHRLALDFDNVPGAKFLASASFDCAVHTNFTALNQDLRVTTGLRDPCELQELIQADRIGTRLGGIVGQGLGPWWLEEGGVVYAESCR